ncbi:hypothetical protein [Bacillus fonticola]|uniref:hypothetical protein n=1 Tax=Bacillus fonticola TaxID=2728853 RepID=UPI001473BB98|nr:hypothetical protein [Bacillus fonticola]
MKELGSYLRYGIAVLTCLLLLSVGGVAFAGEHTVEAALEASLSEEMNNYASGSVQMIEQQSAEVQTVPSSEEEATTIEVVAILIEFNEIRSNLFLFENKEIYYWDQTNSTLIERSDFEPSEEIISFQEAYSGVTGTELQAGSFALFMVLLLGSTIVIPVLVILLHNSSHPKGQQFFREAEKINF